MSHVKVVESNWKNQVDFLSFIPLNHDDETYNKKDNAEDGDDF